MRKQKISLVRFKWKPNPWMIPENIKEIWLYSSNGVLSFELELNPDVDISSHKIIHARNSRHPESNNFIKIMDPKIISAIGKKIKELTIVGARGNSVILGEIDIPLRSQTKSLILMSTLKDWKDWLRYK